ncbi:hypothetical protein PNEG_00825 [Pneumocystis murina B123]|uniref:Uncharacterized protein n=1 Tax=Pneumocystis murina (strain B123) TaxID=1069680 RepID=M7NVS7_PNEMU|nr:hypothetical protein PNEG_00825 [Pneumocystis murina B123]EMR11236.1 hypothetical protein PNEG_00825 [Pneumocystis murina B123]
MSRVDIDPLLKKLQIALKTKWTQYQIIVTDFISGKMNREEFDQQINLILEKKYFRLHNEILLTIYTNAMCDPPEKSCIFGWTKKSKEYQRIRVNDQRKELKSEIMSLHYRDRLRIKSIKKAKMDSLGRSLISSNTLFESRIAKLPKMPLCKDKIFTDYASDIQRGYHVPLSCDSMEIPDIDSLRERSLAIALESGLIGGLKEGVPEIILAGLEYHLKNVLAIVIAKVRFQNFRRSTHTENLNNFILFNPNKPKRKQEIKKYSSLTIQELGLAFQLAPFSLVETPPPITRIWATTLTNNATYQDNKVEETILNVIKENPRCKKRFELALVLDELLAGV